MIPTLDQLSAEQILLSIWGALRRIETNLALPPAPLELPAPQVTVLPAQVDLTDVIEAVNGLKPGATASDIAAALADLLAPGPPPDPNVEVFSELAAQLKTLNFRIQGIGAQAYGGGSVTLQPNQTVGISGEVEVKNDSGNPLAVSGTFWQATQPVSGPLTDSQLRASAVPVTSTFQTNQTGVWAYYAGTAGTVNVTAGQRVLGITAVSTGGGTMTINGGATVTIPANGSVAFAPQGTLTAPVLVFTGTASYVVEVVG